MGYYIYGAGRIGRLMEEMLLKNGYEVEAFLDVNAGKLNYKNYPILNPDVAVIPENAEVIVALAMENVANATKYFMQNKGYKNVVLWSDEKLREKLCPERSGGGCARCIFVTVCPLTEENSTTGKICLNSLSVCLTMRCSLNCKFCLSLIPMAKRRNVIKDLDAGDFRSALQVLEQYVSTIKEYSLVGGEPLLNKNIGSVLEAIKNSKIRFSVINILTNGTIPLSEPLMKALKDNRVKVTIDHYGDKLGEREKKMIEENINRLEENNCNYTILDNTNGTWYDYGNFEDRRLSKCEVEQRFKNCVTGECIVLSPECYIGRCGRHMAMVSIFGGIPGDQEWMDLLNEKENVRDKLTQIVDAETLGVCNYCNGFGRNNIVSAGEQLGHEPETESVADIEISGGL